MTPDHRPRIRHALSTLAAALVLAGCATPPPAVDTAALQPVPAAFKEAPADGWTVAPPADALPRGRWWAVFGDPVLDGLLLRAVERNTSLQAAAARLAQAHALQQQAQAERRPVIDVAAGAVRQTQPLLDNQPATQGSLAARLSNRLSSQAP